MLLHRVLLRLSLPPPFAFSPVWLRALRFASFPLFTTTSSIRAVSSAAAAQQATNAASAVQSNNNTNSAKRRKTNKGAAAKASPQPQTQSAIVKGTQAVSPPTVTVAQSSPDRKRKAAGQTKASTSAADTSAAMSSNSNTAGAGTGDSNAMSIDTASAGASQQAQQVDEGLYSRQLYVMGHEAQQRLSRSRVLLVGCRGLGLEVAKNLALAGLEALHVCDDELSSASDLGSNFYLRPRDVVAQHTRANAMVTHLRQLNQYVSIEVVKGPVTQQVLLDGKYSVVLVTDHLTATKQPVQLKQLVTLNALCHSLNIAFLSASALGLFGHVFVDLGDAHIVHDTNGELALRGLISHVNPTSSAPTAQCDVTVHEEQRHGLSQGDVVTFDAVQGAEWQQVLQAPGKQYEVLRVLSPYSFVIGANCSAAKQWNSAAAYFQQVKQPATLKFQRLEQQLKAPSLVTEWTVERQLHSAYLALCAFHDKHQRMPAGNTWDDAKQVAQLSEQAASQQAQPPQIDAKLVAAVARCARTSLAPVCAVLGGIVAQEVLKACSGKFNPVQQWMIFDATHALPEIEVGCDLTQFTQPQPASSNGTGPQAAESLIEQQRYTDQITAFGQGVQQALLSSSWFIVGAGAIGCEMLKNFAMMGIGCDRHSATKSKIFITDMDTIEKSNLSRQFLFRPADIGQLKSVTAAREAHHMNPSLHVESQSLRVGPQSETVYGDEFYEQLTGVVTALDNVEARLYMDGRCVYYNRPMIDSGTLGTKGSVQVVLPPPISTESYASSRDPDEAGIPICTLKHFPNKIEHTIQWARDVFEGFFRVGPLECNQYIERRQAYLDDLAKQSNVQLSNLQLIHQCLITERPKSYAECVQWARVQFEVEFNHKIQQLLHAFPSDSVTGEGLPFWSGPKRAPKPVQFDLSDALHRAFVDAAARLRAHVYHIKPSDDAKLFEQAIASAKLPELSLQTTKKIATTDAEAKQLEEAGAQEDNHEEQVQQTLSLLPPFDKLAPARDSLAAIEFEKDDPTNHHIAFISSCSNLRARNYAIKEASEHETKFIAGKIIPAIATTTALVTGIVCLEVYKLAQQQASAKAKDAKIAKSTIEQYRNFTCNLALPSIMYAEPIAAVQSKAQLATGELNWSIWDSIRIDIGDVTLQQFLDHFENVIGVHVSMISYGTAMLYFELGQSKKKRAERLPLKMTQLVETVTGTKVTEQTSKYLIFECCCENKDDGEEINVPPVRYQFKK